MKYRKFRGKRLFSGRELFDNEHVLVMREDGKVEGIVPLENAGEDIEEVNGIVCPGFINAHCHLELSHLKVGCSGQARLPYGSHFRPN
jgi:cytosine/adenosine deaminase-related metal-dependent hydrolase